MSNQENSLITVDPVNSYLLQVPPWVSSLVDADIRGSHTRVIPTLVDTSEARMRLIINGYHVKPTPPEEEIQLSDAGAKGYIGEFVKPVDIRTPINGGTSTIGNFVSDAVSRGTLLDSQNLGLGTVYFGPSGNGIVTARSYHWWDPHEKPPSNAQVKDKVRNGEVPSYALKYQPLSRKSLEEEKTLFQETPWELQSVGYEVEMFAGIPYGGQVSAVDARTLIAYHKEGGIPTSVEGAACQVEFPAGERKTGEKPSDYRRRKLFEHLAFVKSARVLGVYTIPLSISPESANGGFAWPHLESAHVVNVGQSIGGLDTPLTFDQIAEHLRTATQVNGLHITVGCTPNGEGYVGTERIERVFNLTHGRILTALKIFTHSGNCGSIEQLKASARGTGRMSHREEQIYDNGNGISTAKVGPVGRFDDLNVLEAFVKGATPNIERAALMDEEGNAGRCAHNRLGRPREWGGIETTIFDTEGNQNKIDAMCTLMTVFITSVEKALLVSELDHDGIPSLLRRISQQFGYGEYLIKTFLGVITNHSEFLDLVGNVDTHGSEAKIKIQEDTEWTARDLVTNFLNWVQTVGMELDLIKPKEDSEIVAHFDYLRRVIQQDKHAGSYEEYYGLQGDPTREGGGNLAIVANARYSYLKATTDLSDQEIFNQMLTEHANAYYYHLEALSRAA